VISGFLLRPGGFALAVLDGAFRSPSAANSASDSEKLLRPERLRSIADDASNSARMPVTSSSWAPLSCACKPVARVLRLPERFLQVSHGRQAGQPLLFSSIASCVAITGKAQIISQLLDHLFIVKPSFSAPCAPLYKMYKNQLDSAHHPCCRPLSSARPDFCTLPRTGTLPSSPSPAYRFQLGLQAAFPCSKRAGPGFRPQRPRHPSCAPVRKPHNTAVPTVRRIPENPLEPRLFRSVRQRQSPPTSIRQRANSPSNWDHW